MKSTLKNNRKHIIKQTFVVVARVRRRGDRPPHSMDVWIWKIWGRQGILCLLAVKNGMGVAT